MGKKPTLLSSLTAFSSFIASVCEESLETAESHLQQSPDIIRAMDSLLHIPPVSLKETSLLLLRGAPFVICSLLLSFTFLFARRGASVKPQGRALTVFLS